MSTVKIQFKKVKSSIRIGSRKLQMSNPIDQFVCVITQFSDLSMLASVRREGQTKMYMGPNCYSF